MKIKILLLILFFINLKNIILFWNYLKTDINTNVYIPINIILILIVENIALTILYLYISKFIFKK